LTVDKTVGEMVGLVREIDGCRERGGRGGLLVIGGVGKAEGDWEGISEGLKDGDLVGD
jgi:hypothetical protein